MRLHWHPFSLFPRRVRIVLREKNIACDEVEVNLPAGATRTPEFLRLNPFGQVPVLEDGGLVVYESLAILEYLEEKYPSPALLPAGTGERALARQWMAACGDYFAGPFKRWLTRMFTPEASWNRDDQQRALEEMGRHLDILESLLKHGEHLVGTFSLADVAYAPLVCELQQCELGHLLERRPAVGAWVERLRARPSIRTTSPIPT
jgi:glutathione S-transferase